MSDPDCERSLFRGGPFRGAEGTPPARAISGKLSDSLVGAGRGVNTQFPFGVLNETREKGDSCCRRGTESLLSRHDGIVKTVVRQPRVALDARIAERRIFVAPGRRTRLGSYAQC